MPNLPKPESIRFREIFTTNHRLLKVAGFEPDPSGWVYPIPDRCGQQAYARLLILGVFVSLYVFPECLLYDGGGTGLHQIVQLSVQVDSYGWHMQDNVT